VYNYVFVILFFFFQAEDGIRDKLVTGVQTCALPISRRCEEMDWCVSRGAWWSAAWPCPRPGARRHGGPARRGRRSPARWSERSEIGRASCRERVEEAGGAVR